MELFRSWLGIFGLVFLFLGLPIAVLLILLGTIFKTWYVRWLLALVIWGLFVSSLPSPHSIPEGYRLQFEAKTNMEHLYPALVAYQKDHGGQWPLTFAELVPRYVSQDQIGWFYARSKLGPISREQKAAEQDPSEIDRSGQFVSLSGQGGMLATAKTPIIKRTLGLPWSERHFCVILTTDGQIQTVTNEDYRQRFRHAKAQAR